MRMLQRSVGRYGGLTVLWTTDVDDRTVSVQLDDVVLTADPATRSGPLDAGVSLSAESDGGSTMRFRWTTSQLTGWFKLLAPGLEIRADEGSTVEVVLTVAADDSPGGGPAIGFSWTSTIDGAALVYGGTTIKALPAGTRTIELTSPGERPQGRILIDDGARTYDTDSDLSWVANGWRELHPADPPSGSANGGPTRPPVVKATIDAGGATGPLTMVRFDPLGVNAPSYFPDFAGHVTFPAPVDPVKVPILDVPAQDQWIRWGGTSGQFIVEVETDKLPFDLSSPTSVNAEHLSLHVDHSLGVPLHSRAGATAPITFTHAGFDFTIDGKSGPPLVLRTANGDQRITLGPDAEAEMAYRKLSEEPLRFAISDFTIGAAGLQVDATVLDDPVTLHGLGTSFRFTEGTVLIREGEMLDFSLAGSGPLPPDLVGEAVADIAIQFTQEEDDDDDGDGGTRRAIPVSAGATLGTDGTLLGVVVPFRYDLLGIGLGFEETDDNGADARYDFFFTLTGTATFAPPPGLPSDDPLSMLDAATIELNAAPLTADLSRLAKAMSFRIELAEPVGFKFLRAFSMEIQEIALYGQVDAFDGAPGIELAGQVKFAEGEGDKKRSAEGRHRLVIGPPKPGTVVPRIQLKELGLTIQKGDAFTLDATVNFVDEKDDTGVVTKGFTGEGTLEIQGLPSLAVAVGFMTINRPAEGNHPPETVKAWFIAINVGKLTVKIPYIEIYLREVGLGFGYRYTLTSIAAADAAGGLAEMIAALQEASRTQGDLAKVDAWRVSLEPRGTDPRWTIALRALFTQMASPKSTPLKLDVKSEEKLANVFLFDVLAAVRSDLTILMTARLWLNTNYIDYITDTDDSIQGKPLASGFAIVQPAHQRFLAQVSTNPDGHMGSRPPFPEFLAVALRSVQVAATVMVEPNLVHAELGWPNGLRYSMGIPGVVDVSVEAGLIYRIARRPDGGADLVLGISYKARATMEFRHSVDLGVAGASIVAKASASFGARLIAAAQLGSSSSQLDVYGGLSVDLRVRVSINAWIGVDLGFVEIKKHFSMSLELGFSASLEFGVQVDPSVTEIGFAGRGTLMVRAFGRRFEFGVAISSRPDVVNHARQVTAKYLSLGLEAGDGDLALPPDSNAATATPDLTADPTTRRAAPPTMRPTAPEPGGATTDPEPGGTTTTDPAPSGETEPPDDTTDPEPSDDAEPSDEAPIGSAPVAANWMALALPSDEDDEWTYIVLYPGDGPGFVPVPPATIDGSSDELKDLFDFHLGIDAATVPRFQRYDPLERTWTDVLDTEAAWKIRWRNDEATEEKNKRGLEAYVAAAFVEESDTLLDPVALVDDQALATYADHRVGQPSPDDYEAAVRGTLDQFRRSPHFKPDTTSEYEFHLRAAFATGNDVYESGEVRRARQLRSMMVEQMLGDAREYAALPIDPPVADPEAGETATDPDPRTGSPVFLFGLVLRVERGDWLASNAESLRLLQRLDPDGTMSEPVTVTLFNPRGFGFADDPPEFEQIVQFADEAMVAFDWKLTWSPGAGDEADGAPSVEDHLAHYEVRRRAVAGGDDQVVVTTVKPADALAPTDGGGLALVRRRFEFVDNFDGEGPEEIALLPPTGRTYLYTITPVDVDGGRGRPITLSATRVPSRPPMAPTDVDFTVDYTLTADDFEPADLEPETPTDGSEPETPTGRPRPVAPTGIRVAWTEPAVPTGRRAAPTDQRHLVFRRRSTLPVGSYGLDTATNGAERTDLPSSNAGLRRDDRIVVVDKGGMEEEPLVGGRRWTLSLDRETLVDAGVFPDGPWQPDAWQVFVRTVSDADVPSALVPAKIVLRFEADPAADRDGAANGTGNGVGTGVEERQPAELEWLTGPLGLPPLPADDTVADAGILHVPRVEDGQVVFRPHPADVRAVRVRWNQAPSSANGHDPALTAGFHVFRLDIDAHSDATFDSPERIGQVARLIDEVRLQPVANVDREPRDTRTPGIWESWPPEPAPLPSDLGWPSPTLPAELADVGDHGILHPLLAAVVDQLAVDGDVVVGADTGRPVVDQGTQQFLDTFGPDADPHGWSLLQFLGLATTIGLRDRYTNDVLAGADVLARISTALDELIVKGGDLAERLLDHVRVDLLYQPAAASSLEPDPVPESALLAIVRVSLLPVAPDETMLEEPRYTQLQALVDRASAETGQFVLPSLPVAFLARFAPPKPPEPDSETGEDLETESETGEDPETQETTKTIGYGTAAPRLSAPTRAVPDRSGRVHYDDRITDGYAHAYRYYVRPYGRYDRLWHGLAQSPVFAPLHPQADPTDGADAVSVPARLAVDRPLDVSIPGARDTVAAVGADAVLDRVAELAPPVILASNRVDVAGPGPTWEIVMAAHGEQWLSEQNRTVARRLDYRQIMFTVLRSFRFEAAAHTVDWEGGTPLFELPVGVTADLPALPAVPPDPPSDPTSEERAEAARRAEAEAAQAAADLAVLGRVGDPARNAEVVHITSLPFYYEHRFVAVAQSSLVRSDPVSVAHREFGYRSPAAVGTVTAEGTGSEKRRRTITVALARLWDSLTTDSQTRWPG